MTSFIVGAIVGVAVGWEARRECSRFMHWLSGEAREFMRGE